MTAAERGEGILLTCTWRDGEDPHGEVAASVCFEDFAGRGSAYFDDAELRRFAGQLRRYPLGDAVVRLTGGYVQPDEEHVGLTVQARGRRGQVGLTVHLRTPSDDRSDVEWSSKELTVEVLTAYEALRRFASEVEHLVDGPGSEAWLDAEVLA